MFVSNHTFIVNKPEKMMESFKTIANLWIKFGAKSCRLMDLGCSGIGKMAFISVYVVKLNYSIVTKSTIVTLVGQALLNLYLII
mgnify:CR=1 FL=1